MDFVNRSPIQPNTKLGLPHGPVAVRGLRAVIRNLRLWSEISVRGYPPALPDTLDDFARTADQLVAHMMGEDIGDCHEYAAGFGEPDFMILEPNARPLTDDGYKVFAYQTAPLSNGGDKQTYIDLMNTDSVLPKTAGRIRTTSYGGYVVHVMPEEFTQQLLRAMSGGLAEVDQV